MEHSTSGDREKTSEASKKRGQHSHGGSERSTDEGTERGDSDNLSQDRERASETDKKHGEHSHGGENR